MELPLQFMHENKRLYGVLHIPEENLAPGIVLTIIIGGSQTRIGSHRLYVQLARFLCKHGYSVFRFDYEGMGDSEGDLVLFEDACPSINTAIEFIVKKFNYTHIILWSICIGASAIALYIRDYDSPVSSLIMCNPDIRSKKNEAKTRLKHYYKMRISEKEFWKKLVMLKIKPIDSLRSFYRTMTVSILESETTKTYGNIRAQYIAKKVMDGLARFKGTIDIILSSEDLVSKNFLEVVNKKSKYKSLIKKKAKQHFIKGADHTFTETHIKNEFFEKMLFIVQEIKKEMIFRV